MNTFENLMETISNHLNQNLRQDYRKIWVQGYLNSNNVRFVFTVFNRDNIYRFAFLDLKNVRLPKGNSTQEEVDRITADFFSRVHSTVKEFLVD
jgi:hypothetical protein